jgi:hypothetical protein
MVLTAATTAAADARADRACEPGTRGITLLMTATAAPRAAGPGPGRVDPAIRLGDYTEALRFYLELLGDSVEALVFADNSRTDLAPLHRLVRRSPHASRVEFLRVDGPDQPGVCGRAYEEFRLIDRVMDESGLVQRLGPTDKVWKVTGRYRVVNLPRLVAQAPERYDIYCNARNWPIPSLDLGLIAWSRAGYETAFRGVYRELREDRLPYAPEVHMRAVLDRLNGRLRVVRRYTTEPRIEGVRGWDVRPDGRGCNGAKSQVGQVVRRFTPWVWV